MIWGSPAVKLASFSRSKRRELRPVLPSLAITNFSLARPHSSSSHPRNEEQLRFHPGHLSHYSSVVVNRGPHPRAVADRPVGMELFYLRPDGGCKVQCIFLQFLPPNKQRSPPPPPVTSTAAAIEFVCCWFCPLWGWGQEKGSMKHAFYHPVLLRRQS